MAERDFRVRSTEAFGGQKPLSPLGSAFVGYFLSPYNAMGLDPQQALPDPAQFRSKAGDLLSALERGENPLGAFCILEHGVDSEEISRLLVGRSKIEYLSLLLELPRIAERIFGLDYAARLQFSIHRSVLAEIADVDVEE